MAKSHPTKKSVVNRRNKGPIHQYSQEQLTRALTEIRENGMKVATASKKYNIPRTTLLAGKTSDRMSTVGPEAVLGVETEAELVAWITSNAARGFPINREGLLYSVQHIVLKTNKQTPFIDSKPVKKWFYSFLRRHPTISQKHAEYLSKARACVTEHNIRRWFTETRELLGEDVKLWKKVV